MTINYDTDEMDQRLLTEQEESEKLQQGEQFEAGGNGHDKEEKESETPKADEEIRQYQQREHGHKQKIPPEVIFDKLKEGTPKATYIQKHSENDLLAEAVIVGGIPYFAVARPDTNGEVKITSEKSIPLSETSGYKPYDKEAYLNKPYSFISNEKFESCIERAGSETLDSLYRKVKSIWSKYIDTDDFHISICAADTIFTYFQDKIGMTHYLFFVGNNNCGKSNNLLVLKFLAYRNFTSTDMTAANIYQFLGDKEEGQGTLCEDEADRIDEDRQKMAIHKNGYITGFPVSRIDTSFGRRQLKLNTFSFKAFAAERFPDPFKAKGFNQRVLEIQCYYGNPEQDIAEVANPAGAEEFQLLLDELEETRNLLLAYRLLHFSEKIPDIRLNIKGREKQLFKPVVRVFQNSETLKELLPVISNYVTQKREANDASFNAFLYRAIIDIIRDQKTATLPSRLIWNYIVSNLEATELVGRNQSCETTEFGVITQKEVTQTLEHVFGAKNKKINGIRHLVFNTAKLQRLGKVYDLSIQVEVIREESSSEKSGSLRDLGDELDTDNDIAASSRGLESYSESEEITHEIKEDTGGPGSSNSPYGPQVTLTNASKNVPGSEEEKAKEWEF